MVSSLAHVFVEHFIFIGYFFIFLAIVVMIKHFVFNKTVVLVAMMSCFN